MILREGMRFNQYQGSEQSWAYENQRSQSVSDVDVSVFADRGKPIIQDLEEFGIKCIGTWVVKKVKEVS